MKQAFYRLAVICCLVIMPAFALATPLKVEAAGTGSHTAVCCPKCGTPVAAAAVSDYTIGFSGELEGARQLGLARLAVSVTDRSGAPVNNAKVAIKLTMPEHHHGVKPMTAKRYGNGRYWVSTGQLQMDGVWNAEVAVTPAGGETIRQVFTFRR